MGPRVLTLASCVVLAGCGGKIVDSSDAGVGATDAGGIVPGCPDKPPTSGTLCTGRGHFYCHYYDSPTATCVNSIKCTSGPATGEGPPYAFDYFGPCDARVHADACNEGLPCGSVEPEGRCVVKCVRGCVCNVGKSVLECTKLAC